METIVQGTIMKVGLQSVRWNIRIPLTVFYIGISIVFLSMGLFSQIQPLASWMQAFFSLFIYRKPWRFRFVVYLYPQMFFPVAKTIDLTRKKLLHKLSEIVSSIILYANVCIEKYVGTRYIAGKLKSERLHRNV